MPNYKMMKLQINGEERDFGNPAPETLAALVEVLGMKADRVAVELNRNIVPRDRWSETNLKDGDRLEVVHFVGGGSSACQSQSAQSPVDDTLAHFSSDRANGAIIP